MNGTIEKQELFKEALGNYPTGVTIVTTTDKNNIPLGLTVNSFASVSLDPLLVLWSIDHKVSSIEAFKHSGKFAVHILAGNQAELCKIFASKNVDRFASCHWSLSSFDLPIIEGAFAVLECETYKTIEAGDHTIIIGAVQNIQVNKERNPMLYHRRHFGEIPVEFYS
jgi:flavin reductase (DIM6/NTAB) family NADH-FMN oxidoreductase RutF